MKTKCFIFFSMLLCSFTAFAQDEEENLEEKKGFKKENLFTGGSISLGFANNTFLIGGNPVFGYSIARWVDAGIVVNYIYASQRSQYNNDKLRQTVYGGGVFTRLYPVRFLFAQAQYEHNRVREKYIFESGANPEITKGSGNSFLVGAGYTTGRDPDQKNVYGYLAVLFDIADDGFSPYKDNMGRAVPIIRGGLHIPLFQGGAQR